MSDDNEVGYGKPPKQHQFKKGNQMARRRKGKPKKSPEFSMSRIITDALTQVRQVRRDGQVVNMRAADIMAEQIVKMLTSASGRDVKFMMGLIEKHAAHLVEPPPQEINIVYHRAPGSNVALPPPDLWDKKDK